jgi:hypothetical protein
MFKKIGGLIVTLLGLALLVYSATRSLNFISLTLSADKQALAYVGLAGLDGGLIAWLLSYKYGSRGGWQRGISLLMVIVDLLGAVLMFTADTVFETGKAGLVTAMSASDIQTIVMMLSMIIALNIAAVVGHDLTDPDRLKIQAEEEAIGRIEEMALEQVKQSSGSLAAELAPAIAQDWKRITREKYLNMMQVRPLAPGAIDAVARPALSAPESAIKKEMVGSVLPASSAESAHSEYEPQAHVPRKFGRRLQPVEVVRPGGASNPVGVLISGNGNGNHKNPTSPLSGVK